MVDQIGAARGTHVPKRNTYRILIRKAERKSPLEDLSMGGRIILKLILNK
jgi:hypothetical protein